MTTLPDFHSFRDMCLHLTTGGAAYRYGSNYPIYCGKVFVLQDGREVYSTEMRTFGGSSGELASGGSFGNGVYFSADEQASVNWVFISKADWDAREREMQQFYEKQAEANRKRQMETGLFEGKVGQVVPTKSETVQTVREVETNRPLLAVLWETIRHPFTKSVIRSK